MTATLSTTTSLHADAVVGSRPWGGNELLIRLRGRANDRPRVDPGLAGGLRAWVEDGVAAMADRLPAPASPIRVSWHDIVGILPSSPEVGVSGWGDGNEARTFAFLRGAMVSALFRQIIFFGRIGDPIEDALGALEVGANSERVMAALERMEGKRRKGLHREVVEHSALLVERWRALPPGWMARSGEYLSVPVAGGRIVLTGMVDLLLGGPSNGHASACLVRLRSGVAHGADRSVLGYLALLETIRSGAPARRVATYHSGSGELDVADVSEAMLATAVRLVIEAVRHRCAFEGESMSGRQAA